MARPDGVVCLCVRVARGEDLTPGTGAGPHHRPLSGAGAKDSDKAEKPLSAQQLLPGLFPQGATWQ